MVEFKKKTQKLTEMALKIQIPKQKSVMLADHEQTKNSSYTVQFIH